MHMAWLLDSSPSYYHIACDFAFSLEIHSAEIDASIINFYHVTDYTILPQLKPRGHNPDSMCTHELVTTLTTPFPLHPFRVLLNVASEPAERLEGRRQLRAQRQQAFQQQLCLW